MLVGALLYSTLLCSVLYCSYTVLYVYCNVEAREKEDIIQEEKRERKKERQRRTLDPDCGIIGETDRPRLEQGTVGSN